MKSMWIVAVLIFSFPLQISYAEDTEAWVAPASVSEKANPLSSDAASVKNGKTLFKRKCKKCHGKDGKGKASVAKMFKLDAKLLDLTAASVQEQSDGALFWKVTTGQKRMPKFDKKLNETQRWALINFIRTFSADSKTSK